MPKSLSVAEFDAFFDSKPGWATLTTIDADGYPHSVAIGYFRDGDSVYSGCRDNTHKVRNIERNAKVALLIESGTTSADLKGAMVQGEATVHRSPDAVLECMRKGARARGVDEAGLPTEARAGACYIEVKVVRRRSWDYSR